MQPDIIVGRPVQDRSAFTNTAVGEVTQGSPVEQLGPNEKLVSLRKKCLIYLFLIFTILIVLSSGIAGLHANPLFYILGCLCGYIGIQRLISALLIWYVLNLGALSALEIYFAYFFGVEIGHIGLSALHACFSAVGLAAIIETIRLRNEILLFNMRRVLVNTSVNLIRIVSY